MAAHREVTTPHLRRERGVDFSIDCPPSTVTQQEGCQLAEKGDENATRRPSLPPSGGHVRGSGKPPRSRKPVVGYINPPGRTYDPQSTAFYSSAQWTAFRRMVTEERGERCQDKEHDPLLPRVTKCDLDHIVAVRDGGELFDRNNVMFRCRKCHSKKTKREISDRNRREYWGRYDRQTGG
jgi:hypothetical protein